MTQLKAIRMLLECSWCVACRFQLKHMPTTIFVRFGHETTSKQWRAVFDFQGLQVQSCSQLTNVVQQLGSKALSKNWEKNQELKAPWIDHLCARFVSLHYPCSGLSPTPVCCGKHAENHLLEPRNLAASSVAHCLGNYGYNPLLMRSKYSSHDWTLLYTTIFLNQADI